MIYCCTREHIDTNMFNIVAADLHSTSSTGNVFTPGVSILCCGDASSPSTHVDYQHKKELPDHSLEPQWSGGGHSDSHKVWIRAGANR